MASLQVFHAEALGWLAANTAPPGSCVVTSLPDVSELPGVPFDAWRSWFVGAARAVIEWVPREGAAVFFQSDIRRANTWVDKGYLVQRAAEEAGAVLLWHRIVCRKPAGGPSLGRPTYSHMLCFTRRDTLELADRVPRPDVLPSAGFMRTPKAMGVEACRVSCEFLRDVFGATTIVDPFCGRGSVLFMANELGMDAIGVDLSARCCSAARRGPRVLGHIS
ncbi:MAG: hypothetical protein U0174_24605 [Polyangiaceae bacterium]